MRGREDEGERRRGESVAGGRNKARGEGEGEGRGPRGQRGAGSQPGTLAGFLPLYPLGFSENVSKFSLSREDRLPAYAVASPMARGISEEWTTYFIFMHRKRGENIPFSLEPF